MRSALGVLVSSVIVASALAGCGTATEAAKVTSSSPGTTASSPAPDPGTSSEAPQPTESESAIATKFKVGDTAKIGDWEVTVTKVSLPTMKQVKSWNMFNDSPDGAYVLAAYSAKYVGTERTADAQFDLTLKFGGSDGQVYDEASVVTASDKKNAPTEVRPGGTAKLEAVFDVPAKAVKGGVVTVEGRDADFQTVYADFSV